MLSRTWTLTKIELYKLIKQKIFYITICLLIIVVGVSVVSEKFTHSGKIAINGFNPLISGCLNGFRISAFLILILGSLLFASETTFGTIKTILVAPIKRSELFMAKAMTIIILAIMFTIIIESISFISSWVIYGFADITDPTFPEIVHLSKLEMLRYVVYAFIHIVLPVITIGLMGLFISTLIENAGIAVAIAIIAYLIFDIFIIGMFENVSSFLFNYYLNYYLATLKDISEGVLQEIWKFKVINLFFKIQQEDTLIDVPRKIEIIKSIVIPIFYSASFLILSIIAVNKKMS
jgi:ABC-type transport system involved in multi-copper enzyme maturation permease subunit